MVLLALFVISLPAVTTRIYASDEIQYFAYLRSLWFDGDVSFENEYRYFYDRGVARSPLFHETFLERTTETGRRVNVATIGCAILWAPFYGIAHVVAKTTAGGVADGFSQPYIAAVCYASALYGLVAVLLSLAIARRVVGAGVGAALTIWVGTPLLFYMYVAPPMSHAVSAFAVAAFLLAWLQVRERWSVPGCALLGALAALLAMVREQDAFIAVGPLIDFAWRPKRGTAPFSLTTSPKRGRTPFWRAGAAAGAAFAIVFAPQALAYIALNGRLGPSPLVSRKMIWTSPHAAAVIMSPEHGFFWWTPIAVLSLAGLVWLAARRPASGMHPEARRLAVCALVMVGMQVYIAGSVDSWTVAGAFGQRRFVALTAILALGLAALWRLAPARRAMHGALGVVVALGVWWNIGLIAQFGSGLMDRQRLEPARNAYTNFVVLPRVLPELAYHYLVDRESFYRRGAPADGTRPGSLEPVEGRPRHLLRPEW